MNQKFTYGKSSSQKLKVFLDAIGSLEEFFFSPDRGRIGNRVRNLEVPTEVPDKVKVSSAHGNKPP